MGRVLISVCYRPVHNPLPVCIAVLLWDYNSQRATGCPPRPPVPMTALLAVPAVSCAASAGLGSPAGGCSLLLCSPTTAGCYSCRTLMTSVKPFPCTGERPGRPCLIRALHIQNWLFCFNQRYFTSRLYFCNKSEIRKPIPLQMSIRTCTYHSDSV